MLKDVFADILTHTYGLGFIEMVKIVTEEKTTEIKAMDDQRTVVVYGKLKNEVEELEGTVGLSRMAVLAGYLKFPPFSESGATVVIEKQKRGNEEVPAEIVFSSPTGHKSNYRFMHKDMAEEQIKIPAFKGAKWDVTFTPTEDNLRDLGYFGNILGSYEPVFTPVVENNKLCFCIGSGPTDRAIVPVVENPNGLLKGDKSWPLTQTLAILKLATKADKCTMKFAAVGALSIEIETPVSEYEYILPARVK